MLGESMEKDFMGLGGKEVKGEAGGGHQDSGASQWPFAPRQFISHEAMRQESPINRGSYQYSARGYLPVLTQDTYGVKINTELSTQKPFSSESSDKQVLIGGPFFTVHGAPNGPDLAVTSLKQQPFFRGTTMVNSPTVGSTEAFDTRILSKPTTMTSQLTIFYAGAVNVYNDIPLDKAQAIMFSASKVASDAVSSRSERLLLPPVGVKMVDGMNTDESQTQNLNHMTSPCPILPIRESETLSSSGIANDIPQSKTTETVVPTNPVIRRAIPQARNASLARFLERRKERVSNALPYGHPK
ncbi:putative transcription factor TIFY family [Dioscorea sansibarensis]